MRTTTSNGHRDGDEDGDEDENEGSDEDEDEEKVDFLAVEIGAVATRTKPCKGSWACSKGYFRFGGDCDEQVVQHCKRCRASLRARL